MMKQIYTSPFGDILLIVDKGFLVYCNWMEEECNAKLHSLEKNLGASLHTCDQIVMNETISQLKEYFSGKRKEFNIPMDASGSPFRKKVWEAIRGIRHGEVATYKELANKIGSPSAYRAVAQACGANPIAIVIPCHRVIGSGASLGGYTGGIEKKIALLSLENQG